MKSRALVAASILLLAGCGGGGGGATPQPRPTVLPTNSPTNGYQNTASLRLTIPLGAKPGSDVRHPQYVSPNSAILVVTVNTVNNAPPPSWVTPNPQTVVLTTAGATPNCILGTGTETCTVTVAAPPGTVNYTFQVEDGSSHVLSTVTTDEVIVQGSSNNLTVTLQGVPSSVTIAPLTLTASSGTPGTATTSPLAVSVLDASGAQIVDGTTPATYTTPVTLTDNDSSGQTSIDVNGGTPGSTVTLNRPTDIVTLHYTGEAINSFTIGATGTGVTSSTATISTVINAITLGGTTLDDAAHGGLPGDPNFNQPTLFFSTLGGTQSFSAAELGWTQAPYNQQFNVVLDAATCGTGAAAVAKLNTTLPATSFSITSQNAGFCKATVTEAPAGLAGHGGPTVVWFSVTTAGFGVN